MAAENIPTPDEINRVTEYLQTQAAEAQATLIAAKHAAADLAQSTANDLVANNNVSGVVINRKSWDDETLPWQKRGDIETIRMDFDDGTQALVTVGQSGDSLDLTITPGTPVTSG